MFDIRVSAYPGYCISANRNYFSGAFTSESYVYANGGISYRIPDQFMTSDDVPKWMKCPHCGVRNRTDQKTVLTCDCCGGNLEANTL